MRDVLLCCDCLVELPVPGLTTFRRSEMPPQERAALDAQFDASGLVDVYMCQTCYERFQVAVRTRKRRWAPEGGIVPSS